MARDSPRRNSMLVDQGARPEKYDSYPLPAPSEGERPTIYADRVGEWYAARKSDRHRKEHGLFLAPVPVADFMAGRTKAGRRKLRILEPAAEAGVLCCATVEALVSRKPGAVELVAHEVDEDPIAPLRAVLDCLAGWCRARGVALAVRVEAADLILAHAGALHSRGGILPAGRRRKVSISSSPIRLIPPVAEKNRPIRAFIVQDMGFPDRSGMRLKFITGEDKPDA